MGYIIKNIKALVQTESEFITFRAGEAMKNLPFIENAFLVVVGDKIFDYGGMSEFSIKKYASVKEKLEVIDATGKMVFPSFCDSHTHIVYAGSREKEYVDKIKGLSYEEIAKRGGGILNSAKRLHEATEDELFEDAMLRLQEMASYGTGAVEIKSGYGLNVEDELKMLRVIRRLKESSPLTIKSNFLGAHACYGVSGKSERLCDLIINEMIPLIAAKI